MLACEPLLHEHRCPFCAEFILTGEASASNKRGQRDVPPSSHLRGLYFPTLRSPAVFLASHHFYINLFLRPSVFFCTFSSIPAQLLFDLPPALPWCSLTPLLPLPAFSQSFRHICICTILLPNTFYELNPFSRAVSSFGGRYRFASRFFLFICSLAGSQLSLLNHRECVSLSIKAISLVLDEIVFRICNLREHRNALLFISLYSR